MPAAARASAAAHAESSTTAAPGAARKDPSSTARNAPKNTARSAPKDTAHTPSPGPDLLTLGVLAGSSMENERRLPIHPSHLERIDPDLRARMIIEEGYAQGFPTGAPDLRALVGRVGTRDEVIDAADVLLQPKPQAEELAALPEHRIVWGWPHCVQDRGVTQAAIDRRLTLIAFEAMNHWTADGRFGLHVFHQNNELAGYASVLHALALLGLSGDYGPRLSAAVIGFGSTARGAVTALNAQGITAIDVLTHRGVAAVAAPIRTARIIHLTTDEGPAPLSEVATEGGPVPLPSFLAEHDIVINCTLQDVAAPVTYLRTPDLQDFAPGSLIIDVSCDAGMGFEWARPTTFAEPMLTVGNAVHYYAVDHSPSYLWNSATWEISEALLPFLRTVMSGPAAWAASATISRAIEIRDGVIENPRILAFQGRASSYPHAAASAHAPRG